jgi:hypothetical protein
LHSKTKIDKESIEKIDAKGIVKFSICENGIVRPKFGSIRKELNMGDVKGGVPQIIRGNDGKMISLFEKNPEKASESKKSEDKQNGP